MRSYLPLLRLLRALVIVGLAAGWRSASAEPAPAAPPARPTSKGCPEDKVWSDEHNGCICTPPTHWDDASRKCTLACPSNKVPHPHKPGICLDPPKTCPPGKRWSDPHNGCVTACPPGKTADAKGTGCIAADRPEPPERQPERSPERAPEKAPEKAPARPPESPPEKQAKPERPACPAGKEWSAARNACVLSCPVGKTPDPKGTSCVAIEPKRCPDGKEWKDAFEACVPICPPDQVLDFYGVACHPIRRR